MGGSKRKSLVSDEGIGQLCCHRKAATGKFSHPFFLNLHGSKNSVHQPYHAENLFAGIRRIIIQDGGFTAVAPGLGFQDTEGIVKLAGNDGIKGSEGFQRHRIFFLGHNGAEGSILVRQNNHAEFKRIPEQDIFCNTAQIRSDGRQDK